jgi:hypothetical protein
MKRFEIILLFLLGLAAVALVAVFQQVPGYMDADYYYAGGLQLASGQGLSEPFLWNYLDDPAGVPHPSHAYWMPLASFIAAVGMRLSGLFSFSGARLGFLLVAACLPPLVAVLAHHLTSRHDHAWQAGLFAAFPAFYLAYLGTTDNFGVYMLLGGFWFLVLVSRPRISALFQPVLLGLLSGLMHLARADGLLWLFVSFLAVLYVDPWLGSQESSRSRREARTLAGLSFRLGLVLAGYLLVMAPWFLRNLTVFGTPLSPAGGKVLWLTRFDELYAYPASILTPDRWWASGLGPILADRWKAVGQNLLSAFAVQGSIFLAPLILLGGWRLRRDRRIQLGGLAWLLTLFSMTAIFPHQGWRGGFFHSGAALQPLLWALAPVGLDVFIEWGARRRGWQSQQARAVFGTGLVSLSLLLATLVVYGRVIGKDFSAPAWASSSTTYRQYEATLRASGAVAGDIVAVNNPAGYFSAAGRPAIAIPDGEVSVLQSAALRYGARWVVLEKNHPQGLSGLYQQPADLPGLRYVASQKEAHIFEVIHGR